MRLTLRTLAQMLRHVKLKWELKSIIDLQTVPGLWVILGARQAKLEDGWAPGQFLALCHSCLFIARIADDPFHFFISKVGVYGVTDAFVTFDEAGDVEELIWEWDTVLALVTSEPT